MKILGCIKDDKSAFRILFDVVRINFLTCYRSIQLTNKLFRWWQHALQTYIPYKHVFHLKVMSHFPNKPLFFYNILNLYQMYYIVRVIYQICCPGIKSKSVVKSKFIHLLKWIFDPIYLRKNDYSCINIKRPQDGISH